MGILPSRESHEYPGAFHFAQSGTHAMAILPLTEHFFPSVDSLAFKQLYACRDLQSAKYNFSLVSPQIIAKYRERAMEQVYLNENKCDGGGAGGDGPRGAVPPPGRRKPKPYIDHASDSTPGATATEASVGDTELSTEEQPQWVPVHEIDGRNFNTLFREDTRCISPDESEWPFARGEEELCGELQHPNPSAHWRTHDSAKQWIQLENREMGLTHTPYVTAGDGVDGNQLSPTARRTADGAPVSPHSPNRAMPRELGLSPAAAAQYAEQEHVYIDRFFSRSPEALYKALVVEPNAGFLVDTNREMCDIYAEELRWKEARTIVRAYRQQCKTEANMDSASETETPVKEQQEDAQPRTGDNRFAAAPTPLPTPHISKEEAEAAEKVPAPKLFLRPAPQVIVVRIQREEEEALRAAYFAKQNQKVKEARRRQRQQQRQLHNSDDGKGAFLVGEDGTCEEDPLSAVSQSTSPRVSAARSPVSPGMPLPLPNSGKSPTPCSLSDLHTPTNRYHRFEDEDKYKDGRIHLVEEDGVLYMFAYNTAYVDPRRRLKERQQQREERRRARKLEKQQQQQQKQQQSVTRISDAGDRATQSSCGYGDDDGVDEVEEAESALLEHERRQTSSFYHTVDAFDTEENVARGSSHNHSSNSVSGTRMPSTAATTTAAAAQVAQHMKQRREQHEQEHAKAGQDATASHEQPAVLEEVIEPSDSHPNKNETPEDEEETEALLSGARGRQQETSVFVEGTKGAKPIGAFESSSRSRSSRSSSSSDSDDEEDYVGDLRARGTSMSLGSADSSTSVSAHGDRPRAVQQLHLFSAAPFILPICPVRIVGCNGYTESSCRGTPWLRGYEDEPEEDAYVESLPVRPPIMTEGGFIDANIGDKILSRAFLLGFQVFRNVCLDAGLPETLTRPFWTLGLLSNIPLLQILREMRFRMRAAAAEVQLGFQGLREMIKGTENDLQSYIYGFSDILPYLERASRERLQQSAAEEAAMEEGEAAGDDEDNTEQDAEETGKEGAAEKERKQPLVLPGVIESPYVVPTRARQQVVQHNLRFPRSSIEFFSQLVLRGNMCLARVRTEAQQAFFHLIAEATAPVSTSLFMQPLELSMYDYSGAIRLHLLCRKGTDQVERQVLPPPKNALQLLHDHQRRVELRAQAAEHVKEDTTGATTTAKVEVSMPPYLVYAIVHPSTKAIGPSLEHHKCSLTGSIISGADAGTTAGETREEEELLSMPGSPRTTSTPVQRTPCVAQALHRQEQGDRMGEEKAEDNGSGACQLCPHQYLYASDAFVDGDMVVYNVHTGAWEHFEPFHRRQVAHRRAERAKKREQQQEQEQQQVDSAAKEAAVGKETEEPESAEGAAAASTAVAPISTTPTFHHDEDAEEEDVHLEDILLCWIKRRLQSATMRNRLDPGWLRDCEGNIVQEGRYYIWGFEHDDQRYFYGLIPKFAKEKKCKRHNGGKKGRGGAAATGSVSGLAGAGSSTHSRSNRGGMNNSSSCRNSPSAMSISPSMSNMSGAEQRPMSRGRGSARPQQPQQSRSPGARSICSAQSTITPSPRSQTSGVMAFPPITSGDEGIIVGDAGYAELAESVAAGYSVYADGPLVAHPGDAVSGCPSTFSPTQQQQPMQTGGNRPAPQMCGPLHHHANGSCSGGGHAPENTTGTVSPESPIRHTKALPRPTIKTAASSSGGSTLETPTATTPSSPGPSSALEPREVSSTLKEGITAAAAPLPQHQQAVKAMGSIGTTINRAAYPPRVLSAPLQTAVGRVNNSNNGGLTAARRSPLRPPPPPPPAQQQQQPFSQQPRPSLVASAAPSSTGPNSPTGLVNVSVETRKARGPRRVNADLPSSSSGPQQPQIAHVPILNATQPICGGGGGAMEDGSASGVPPRGAPQRRGMEVSVGMGSHPQSPPPPPPPPPLSQHQQQQQRGGMNAPMMHAPNNQHTSRPFSSGPLPLPPPSSSAPEEWYSAPAPSGDYTSPPPPPAHPSAMQPENMRGYANAPPVHQPPHITPLTTYMSTAAHTQSYGLNTTGPYPQQQQQQAGAAPQVPQPRRAQMAAQQAYAGYNPQQQQQMSMAGGPSEMSVPPTAPPIQMSVMPMMHDGGMHGTTSLQRNMRGPPSNNSGGGPMGRSGNVQQSLTPAHQGYGDSYAGDAPAPQQQQQRNALMQRESMYYQEGNNNNSAQQQQQQQGGDGGGYYAQPQQQQQQRPAPGSARYSTNSGGQGVYPSHSYALPPPPPPSGMPVMQGAGNDAPPMPRRPPTQQQQQQQGYMDSPMQQGGNGSVGRGNVDSMSYSPQQQSQQQGVSYAQGSLSSAGIPMSAGRLSHPVQERPTSANTFSGGIASSNTTWNGMNSRSGPPSREDCRSPPVAQPYQPASSTVSTMSHSSQLAPTAGSGGTGAVAGPAPVMRGGRGVVGPNGPGNMPYPNTSVGNYDPQGPTGSVGVSGGPGATGYSTSSTPSMPGPYRSGTASYPQQSQQQQSTYGRESSSHYGNYGSGNSGGGYTGVEGSSRVTNSPPPPPSQQQHSQPSSYAPTPVPPSAVPQRGYGQGGPTPGTAAAPSMNSNHMQGVGGVISGPYNQPPQQQQQQSGYGANALAVTPSHPATIQRRPYSGISIASPNPSYASSQPSGRESAPSQQQSQQPSGCHGGGGGEYRANYAARITTSPTQQQQQMSNSAPQGQQQSMMSTPAGPMRGAGVGQNMSTLSPPQQQPQQRPGSATGSQGSYHRLDAGTMSSSGSEKAQTGGGYPANVGGGVATAVESGIHVAVRRLHHTATLSPLPPQQPQQIPVANASGTLLRTSPGPQQRPYQRPQQQQQPTPSSGAYSSTQSPTTQHAYSQQQQPIQSGIYQNEGSAHYQPSPHRPKQQQQQQRMGDSYGDGGTYEHSTSAPPQSRFAHNPYALQ